MKSKVNLLISALCVLCVTGIAQGAALSDRDQVWSQFSPGIGGLDEAWEAIGREDFGASIATGDFNNDGYDDLAIGIPLEAVAEKIGQDGDQIYYKFTRHGAVSVIFGSASGLDSNGSQFLHQDSPGLKGGAEHGDFFGEALAVGDFDRDGHDDLAIGIPGEDIGDCPHPDEKWKSRENCHNGAVQVLYGAPEGFDGRDQFWHQDSSNIKGHNEEADNFGDSLAAGDFDGDGHDDLAIGVPHEDLGECGLLGVKCKSAGAVQVLYGGPDGLTSRDQAWNQDDTGIKGSAEKGDRFGGSLAAGDFDNDGRDDLAIGVPGEDIGECILDLGKCSAGAVQVLYGGSNGLTSRDQFWSQDSDGLKGASEHTDHFGSSLTTGDFDNDGIADLAIGIPREDFLSVLNPHKNRDDSANQGAVQVLYGSEGRLSSRDQVWHRDQSGIKGSNDYPAHWAMRFGTSIAAGDFDGNGSDDLAIGAPGDSPWFSAVDVSESQSGNITVLYSDSDGLTSRDQIWWRGDEGIQGEPRFEGHFGRSLAAGDFNGDGRDDLAVGVVGNNSGEVQVLYADLNVKPEADAGPDLLVESDPDNSGSWVVVDSSRSSDPDGDEISHRLSWDRDVRGWYDPDGGRTPPGSLPPFSLHFPVGSHQIELQVTDSLGLKDFDTVMVEVADYVTWQDGLSLEFEVQPGSGEEESSPFGQQPVVRVVDSQGNLFEDFDGAVILTLVDERGCGGKLLGTSAMYAEKGVAAFADLAVDASCSGYFMQVESGNIQPLLSDSFAVDSPPSPLNVDVSVSTAMLCEPGGNVNLTVQLTNVGHYALTVRQVDDSIWGHSFCSSIPAYLEPGSAFECESSHSVSGDAGFIQYHLLYATYQNAFWPTARGSVKEDFAIAIESADEDNDGICENRDNCVGAANAGQEDADDDGLGDACDSCTDSDGDGFGNPLFSGNACATDNCPENANPEQSDVDADGIGDICDECTDSDNDGFGDPGYLENLCAVDICPYIADDQSNLDGDEFGDACDQCPNDADNDIDGDNVCGDSDNCPLIANSSQDDWDGDSAGDACDSDADGDGVLNDTDECGFTPLGMTVDEATGCSIEQLVPCDAPRDSAEAWKNHGQYQSELAKATKHFLDKKLITKTQRKEILVSSENSSCGR